MSDNPWEPHISTNTLLELYASRMEKYGGKASEPRPGCLEACLGNAWNAESYLLNDEDDPDFPRPALIFAGYLLFYLTNDHCFSDGNKRLGWSAMTLVLARHNLTIDASVDDAEQFMIAVAGGQMDQYDAVDWLADHLVDLT